MLNLLSLSRLSFVQGRFCWRYFCLIVMFIGSVSAIQHCFALQLKVEPANIDKRNEDGLKNEIQFPDSVIVETVEVEFAKPNFGHNGFPEIVTAIKPSMIRVQGKLKLNVEIKEISRTKQNGKIDLSLEFVRYQPAAEYARTWRKHKGLEIDEDHKLDHIEENRNKEERELKSEFDRFFANDLLPQNPDRNRIEQSTTLAVEFSLPANQIGKVVLEQNFDTWITFERDLSEQQIFIIRFNPKIEHECKHFGIMYVPGGVRNSIEERRAKMRLLSYVPLSISILESILNPVKAVERLREWIEFQIK